jgi:DNA mismatch repair protein MutL
MIEQKTPTEKTIKVLPDQLINRIAAGEVVERPSNVVKELLDNSIDSGADRIEIRFETGGKDLIEISDNGSGISKEQVPLALTRHATSKIRKFDDLWNLQSLGFRGEALPSIASVSRITIKSQPRKTPGSEIALEGGKLKKRLKTWSGSPGTKIRVEDLFFNVPARLKFLKGQRAERTRILRVIENSAIIHPEIEFLVFADGKPLHHWRRCANLEDRIIEVLKWKDLSAKDFIKISHSAYGIKLNAWLLKKPSSNRNSQRIFVNKRAISDKIIQQSVQQAYKSFLMDKEFPGYVLFLDLPGELVDINVHPSKSEVRFADSGKIFGFVMAALKRELEKNFTGAHEFLSKDENIEKELEPETQQDLSMNLSYQNRNHFTGQVSNSLSNLSNHGEQTSEENILENNTRENHNENFLRSELDDEALGSDHSSDLMKLEEATSGEIPENYFKSLQVVGVMFNTYIICKGEPGLILIDQHEAHERITFEKLKQEIFGGEVKTKALLIPMQVKVSPEVMEIFDSEESLELFTNSGLPLEAFGEENILIREIPELISEKSIGKVITKLFSGNLSKEISGISDKIATQKLEQILENIVATMACHGSIRAGQPLSEMQIKELLKGLDELGHAPNCPHGRPAAIRIKRSELEKWFKRKL